MVNADRNSLECASLTVPHSDGGAESCRSCIGEFARTLAYSAFQAPLTALSQILDKATGTNVAPNIEVIKRVDEESFGSFSWHSQQVAAGLGALVPFVACLAATKNLSSAIRAEEIALEFASGHAAATASTFRTGEMAFAGFLQGAVLEPNQNKDKFFQERTTQGITSGATMGAMHIFSNKLSDFTSASKAAASLVNKSFTTGLAGAGAGLVGQETNRLLTGESMSGKQRIESLYQSAFTGASLGAIGGSALRLHQPKTNLTDLEIFVSRNRNVEMPDHDFLKQHKERSASLLLPGSEPRPLSALEQVEMIGILHRDADPLLRKPEMINRFIDHIQGAWSNEYRIADQKDLDAWNRVYKLRTSLESRPGEGESKQDVRDYSAIKRLFKKAEVKADETREELDRAQESYRQRLETGVNDFLAAHQLPKIDLVIGKPTEFKSAASYLDGEVIVKETLLSPEKDEAELVNSIYHELTHLRQDVLHINVIADKLGLPLQPTEAQAQLVKEEFRNRQADDLQSTADSQSNSDSHSISDSQSNTDPQEQSNQRADQLVDDVLRIRKDHPLSPEDRAHAKRVSDAVARHFADDELNRVSDTKYQISQLQNFVNGESNPFVTRRFFVDMLKNPSKFQLDYGFKSIPPELTALEIEQRNNPLSTKFGDQGPESVERWEEKVEYFADLRERLMPLLKQHLESMYDLEDNLLNITESRYFINPLEQEAFPTGTLSHLSYAMRESTNSE